MYSITGVYLEVCKDIPVQFRYACQIKDVKKEEAIAFRRFNIIFKIPHLTLFHSSGSNIVFNNSSLA